MIIADRTEEENKPTFELEPTARRFMVDHVACWIPLIVIAALIPNDGLSS